MDGWQVSRSRDVAAPAERVWDLLADLPRMAEWSPENVGGSWKRGSDGPAEGARFRGWNGNGLRRWWTDVVLRDVERGRSLQLDVSSMGLPVATWRYDLDEVGEGLTRVTESWRDLRPGWFVAATTPVTGVADRAAQVGPDMEATLARLAEAAERG